jgi:hypothetical protein
MKYLKRFNESLRKGLEDKEKVDKLVSEYLAYLTDAGYHIRLQEARLISNDTASPLNRFITVNFKNDNVFNWYDIKYDFIPFLEVLPKHFSIKKVDFHTLDWNKSEYSLDDLVEDKKEVTNEDLKYILIYL